MTNDRVLEVEEGTPPNCSFHPSERALLDSLKKTDSRSCCIDLSVSPLNTVYRLRAERLRYEFSLYRCNARAAQQHKLEIEDRVIIFICMGSMVSLKYYKLMWTMTQVRGFQRTPNYDDPLVRDPISKLQRQLHIFT